MKKIAIVGVDIGTSSSKGVLSDSEGNILRTAVRVHSIDRPQPGWVEMNADIWWDEFRAIVAELLLGADVTVAAVGVSGMGPCVLLTDRPGAPLRPAILYGIDMRATSQIARLTEELGGADAVAKRAGTELSTQSVGPKLKWVADNEPDNFAKARRFFMPSSWLVWNLTGEYVLDHHSASQSSPLYDLSSNDWYQPWADVIAPNIELPRLLWPGDVAGGVSAAAARATGLPAGTPVIAGTIDAWAEALSVGALRQNDLMLMYGTTMFLINTVPSQVTHTALWATTGLFRGQYSLAGGMASGGALTAWLRDLFDVSDYPELLALAADSPPGANGLLMLPYFAGERTPISDPLARGVLAGLNLSHSRGDIYRAAMEAVAFGVRHNIETILEAGGSIERVVAVGGGAQGNLWTQIVSDVTGYRQSIPTHTMGASLGAAFLAASVLSPQEIEVWNPVARIESPQEATRALYDHRYELYLDLYRNTSGVVHDLAAFDTTAGATGSKTSSGAVLTTTDKEKIR